MSPELRLVGEARRAFADMVEGLGERAEEPSLCEGWTAHTVAGHLVASVEYSMLRFVGDFVAARFNMDRTIDRMARRAAQRPIDELAEVLRRQAEQPAPLGGRPGIALTDVVVHTQDVRRPLGLGGTLDDRFVTAALIFLTTDKQAAQLTATKAFKGLRLVATDLGWQHGGGPEVSGTGEAVLLACTGRDTFSELEGDGVAILRSRTR